MLINQKVLVVATSLAAVTFCLGGCEKAAQQQAQAARPPQLVDVQVLQEQDIVIKTMLSGRTEAYQVAEVRPQVSGIVLSRNFTEGAEVTKGQSLYKIDSAVYTASVESAKASLLQAEANLVRAKADARRSSQLVKNRAVSASADELSQANFRVAQANVAAAKAALESARINLRYTNVNSPISGRVSQSEVTPGALVTANQSTALTKVQQLDPIYVDVTQSYEQMRKYNNLIAENKLAVAADGSAKVALFLDDGKQYSVLGKLVFKDAIVNETTGTVRIRAIFDNPRRELLPGMFVRAQLIEGVQQKAVMLDQRAVMRENNGRPYCYVVGEGNKVEFRSIQLGSVEGAFVAVENGLKAGEKVIVVGIQKVRSGATVTIGKTIGEDKSGS